MRIASGAPRIECVTVATLGFNAFAFSDLHGGGVIGVTEGALARLSRQQLQAVVAHEFAHVLSGSYVTVTVSCLLFGIYSVAGRELDEAADAGSDADEASAVLGMVPLRGWLVADAARVVAWSSSALVASGRGRRTSRRRATRATRWPSPRRCASSGGTRRRRLHPEGTRAPLHPRHRHARLAGRLVARLASAARRAHRDASRRRARLADRVRAAGRARGRGLRAPRALVGGAGSAAAPAIAAALAAGLGALAPSRPGRRRRTPPSAPPRTCRRRSPSAAPPRAAGMACPSCGADLVRAPTKASTSRSATAAAVAS